MVKTRAPSLDDIEALAVKALDSLPEPFRAQISDVPIQVTDFPDKDVIKDLGLEDEYDLLGLYQGVSLAEKSVADTPQEPDMIFLYRRPILDYWREFDEDLFPIVRHVLIHEIGHHFGLSDQEMEAIEESADATDSLEK